jgi:diguanylate cyclase (GGDEF)-like protein
VTWAAERVSAVFEGGDVESNHQRAIQACVRIGLEAEDGFSLINQLPQLVELAAGGFGREVPEQKDLEDLLGDTARSLVELNNQFAALVHQLEKTVKERAALAEKLQRANKMLSELAFSDSLTGLANKRAFNNALKREMSRAKRHTYSVALIMIDVDHFRKFNETYGHPVGDLVLRRVGEVLRETVRESDFAARYGGEEFVVILPETQAAGGALVAERVRVALEAARVNTRQGPLGVTASFGVAAHDSALTYEPAVLISAADGALYRAKRAGRNRVEFIESEE